MSIVIDNIDSIMSNAFDIFATHGEMIKYEIVGMKLYVWDRPLSKLANDASFDNLF
jgi:hypothetical protein